MSDRLTITLTATDGASKTFVAVGDAAEKLGDALERVGKSGGEGLEGVGKGAAKAGKDFESAGKSLNTFQQESESAAQNLKNLGDSFEFVSNAGLEQQRLTDGLAKAYGAAGDDMVEFSDHVQDVTKFSNDAAQASLLLANSLTNNYGLATDQVQNLLSVSADLAQMYGMELPDAMMRVAGAIRGEGEAAELLGLNMSDAAVAAAALKAGLEGWNTGAISEAEKAAFRYNLVMEQAGYATGTAAEAAAGANGTIAQLGNEFQDLVQSASAALGPLPAVGAALANVASQAFTVIGGGAALLNMFKGIASSAATARIGTTALAFAFNPVTLAIAGVVAVGYKLFESWQQQKQAAEEYESALGSLDDTIELLRRRGDDGLADQVQGFKDVLASIEDVTAEVEYANTLQSPGYAPDPADLGAYEAQTAAIEDLQDTAALTTPVLQKMAEAIADPNINVDAYLEWANGLIEAAAATTDATDDVVALQTILDRPLSEFANNVQSGVIAPLEDMKATLEDVQGGLGDFVGRAQDLQLEGMLDAAEDVNTLGKAFESLGTPVTKTTEVFNPMMNTMDQFSVVIDQLSAEKVPVLSKSFNVLEEAMASGNFDNTAILTEVDRIMADSTKTIDQKANALFNLAYQVNNTDTYLLNAAASAEKLAWGLDEMASAADLVAAKMEWANSALMDYVSSGQNFFEVQDAISTSVDLTSSSADVLTGSLGATLNKMGLFSAVTAVATAGMSSFEESLYIAEGLDATGEALDRALYYFEQIDALGQRSSAAGTIADWLFGEGGDPSDGLGPLVDLLDAGRIGQEQFNDAVESGVAIQESNLRVQEDLNKMRVDQIPLLEQEQLAYENYIDSLSEMEPLEQRRALALADQAYQSQLASISSNLLAASLGEMPKEVVTDMIVNAAEADPVLKDLLLQYGYIEEGADGTITVNFPDGAGVTTTLADINSSLADLIDLLDNGALDKSYTVKVKAELDLSSLTGGPSGVGPMGPGGGWGGEGLAPISVPVETTMTYVAQLDDQASAQIEALTALVEGVDGTQAVVDVGADASEAEGKFREVENQHDSLDGELSIMDVGGDASDAMQEFANVARSHGNLDGDSSTMYVEGDPSGAYSAINSIAAYDGDVIATSYFDIVTRYSSTGSSAPRRHGGVAGYAFGGLVTAELAEAGMELLHYANGGVAAVMDRGFYGVPAGTYVESAASAGNSLAGMGGSGDIHVHINAPVYGIDDFTNKVYAGIVEAREIASRERLTGQGVV